MPDEQVENKQEEQMDPKKLKRQAVLHALRGIDEQFVEELEVEQVFSLLVLLIGSAERVRGQILKRPVEEQQRLTLLFQKIAKQTVQ